MTVTSVSVTAISNDKLNVFFFFFFFFFFDSLNNIVLTRKIYFYFCLFYLDSIAWVFKNSTTMSRQRKQEFVQHFSF